MQERQQQNILTIALAVVIGVGFLFAAPMTISNNNYGKAFAQDSFGGWAGGPSQEMLDQHLEEQAAVPQEQEEQAATSPPTTAPTVTVRPDDQDLDCKDYMKKNFPASEADPRYGLDRDGDGIACETQVISNGTAVQVDPTPVQEAQEEINEVVEQTPSVVSNPLFTDVIEHLAHALTHIEQDNVPAALVEVDSAITLTLLIQAEEITSQTEPNIHPTEPEPEPQAPVEPEQTVPPQEPTTGDDIAGNVVQAEQVFGTTLQECIDEIINAGLLIIQSEVQQSTGQNVTVGEVEQVANETGTTEEIVEVISENIPEIVSNQTTVEEVVAEEVAPVIEENLPEIEEGIQEIVVEI